MADLIDVHSHFLADRFVAEAIAAGHTLPDGMPAWPTWDAETHRRLMDRWGIARSILSISSPGVHFGDPRRACELSRHVNDVGAATATGRADRFGHFASLPLPDVDASVAEAVRALDELDSDGIAVLSSAAGRYLGDERYVPLWAEIDRRDAVVFVHPTSSRHAEELALGRPRSMMEFFFDSACAAADLVFAGALARFPRVRWLFSHCGGTLPVLADRLDLSGPSFWAAPPSSRVSSTSSPRSGGTAPDRRSRVSSRHSGRPSAPITWFTAATTASHPLPAWTPSSSRSTRLARRWATRER
ncbi:amidohydrolase family protein [Nocardioides sp. CER19]|uniref:amidohydrolase family protein n=1 Tax=Nocardioides sp. CER19 TaxID=3038538 RepID=UPI00244C02C4|nr:amidohydrolase family protein [Nocardioides sp. CER19]MDH2415256.1 amidohydrolase family protein [Nocardioides sp. CER19]